MTLFPKILGGYSGGIFIKPGKERGEFIISMAKDSKGKYQSKVSNIFNLLTNKKDSENLSIIFNSNGLVSIVNQSSMKNYSPETIETFLDTMADLLKVKNKRK